MKQFFFLSAILSLSFLSANAQETVEEKDPIFGNSLPATQEPFAQSRTITGTKPPAGNTPSNSGIVSNPIDGGLSILLATGALYGARRLRKSHKAAQ